MKPIIRINIEHGLRTKFRNISEIVSLGYKRGGVLKCCRGEYQAYKGHKWYYLEDYLKMNKVG